MALSGSINGTFSGWTTSKGYPYVEWSIVQNITGNYSDVTAKLHFVRSGAYFSYNASFSNTSNINGTTSTTNSSYDLRPGIGDYTIRTVTQRVYHNSDGTKSCWIGWSGDTGTSTGTFNFGATVTFNTIPREAYITNNVDFQVENDIPITLSNAGNQYVRTKLYVNSVLIQTDDFGQITSETITLDSTDDDNIYAEMPNSTSIAGYIRVQTFSDAGYTTQIGSNKDKTLTVSIDQTTNKPTFTTYSLSNVDKSVVVQDKYSNTLVTSSTSTLLGGNTRMIKGVSKIRATISSANKMIALNSATADFYRFSTSLQQIEADYSTSDVTLDLDNVVSNIFNVTAYDSRSLATTVNSSLAGGIADYFNVSAFGLTLARDNNVDSETKLTFNGTMFAGYFGGGTTGIENTITAHYRYKETTVAWGAQTWNSITVSVDGSGNITFDDYISGDLGASGFDTEKSFDIEVRLYDKLSQTIIESTLSRGIPLVDFTQSGAAINAKYDDTEGGSLQVDGKNIKKIIDVQRQDNTTNSIQEESIVVSGWGFVLGDGDDAAVGTITFPVTFTSKPIVVVGALGIKSGSDPADIGDFSAQTFSSTAYNISTTGFGVVITNVRGNTHTSTNRLGYSWIAFGKV